MSDSNITISAEQDGVFIRLYRGEGNALIAMDLDERQLQDNFVGFTIEAKTPGGAWKPVWNRLHFDYSGKRAGQKGFPSTEAPFQKFRWVYFPTNVENGEYHYRITPRYMRDDAGLDSGPSVEAAIDLAPVTRPGFLNVGFTRGFASSQSYAKKFNNRKDIIPSDKGQGAELAFDTSTCQEEYAWLGFEARRLLFDFLDECIAEGDVTVDAMIYEMREPDVLRRLEKLGGRLRAIIDDHGDYGDSDSNESEAARRLMRSAGSKAVRRTHFKRQQHNKVLIAKRKGVPFKVLNGSTNFSLRGLYIQANNMLVFTDGSVAALYEEVFNSYWSQPSAFSSSDLAVSWHRMRDELEERYSFCFSPHRTSATSLKAIGDAIRNAKSSVLYAVAFLNQNSGQVREELDALMTRPLFSYGLSDKQGSLEVYKPGGERGLVPFSYLAGKVPQPFSREWGGGAGIHIHHKFVVCDFNGHNPVVFTGSSNLAGGGEEENGDNLIMIEDRKVAAAYMIEAIRLFDHYHFRASMFEADSAENPKMLTLRKPPVNGEHAWFEEYYRKGSVKERDRLLFACKENGQ